MGAGIVMMLIALAAYRGRHVIGPFQANVLLEAFHLGRTGSPRSQPVWPRPGLQRRSCC